MRLASYFEDGRARAAVVAADDTLVPVADLVPGGPDDMLDVLDTGPQLWDRLRSAGSGAGRGRPLSGARLLAPIPRPRRNVFCVGWNYSEHFAEGQGRRGANEPEQPPEHPALFSKQPNTVVGPDAPVWHPAPVSNQLDWEVELAVVIGREGRDIPEARGLEHVFGYTIGNDVSVRDVQLKRHGGQWFKGKNFDSHCPLGPWIVTADEIPDPHSLRLATRVNGQTKQDSNTRFMVFKVPRLIEEFSAGLRLQPGDVILTGTPAGVGQWRTPPEYLNVGDVMELEIERIGILRNTVAAYEPSSVASGQLSAAGAERRSP